MRGPGLRALPRARDSGAHRTPEESRGCCASGPGCCGRRSLEEDAHGRRARAARLSAVLAAAAAPGVRGSREPAGRPRGERTGASAERPWPGPVGFAASAGASARMGAGFAAPSGRCRAARAPGAR